jgi:predicted flap endonuclease-1-like 5' DNA nuclease
MQAAGDGSQTASAGAGRAADGNGAATQGARAGAGDVAGDGGSATQGARAGVGDVAGDGGSATQGASAGAGRAAAEGSSVAVQGADAGVQAADGGAVSRPGEALQNFVVQQGEEEDDEGEVRPERVFIPGAKEAIRLRPGTSELFLMTQIRDEAHRFAITHHRKRRGKRALHSALDEIQGVGPAIKKALLHEFGTVAAIAAADEAALQKVKGVGAALAKRLREELGGEA